MNTPPKANPYTPPQSPVAPVVLESPVGQLAGRGRRLGAIIVDTLIQMTMMFIPFLAAGGTAMFTAIGRASAAGQSPDWVELMSGVGAAMIAALVGFVVWAAITLVLVKRHSQTIAKRMLGIKVVRKGGAAASLGRIFWLRNVVSNLPGSVPVVGSFWYIVDSLFILGDTRQCLHDRIADTQVVNA